MKLKLLLMIFPLVTWGALPPASKKMRYGVVHGKVKQVKDCLDKGESPLGPWPTGGTTPLMMAIRWDKKKVAELLASNNLVEQAQAENHSKKTALHFAAEVADISMIVKLLEAGANLKHVDANSTTPLFTAVKCIQTQNNSKHIHAIRLLFEAADCYLSPEEKQLWPLVRATQNQEVISLLEPYFFKRKIE
jgi:ankyrin repeat protein